MNKKDMILLHLFSRVKQHADPSDHPVSSFQIAADTHLPLQKLLVLSQKLAEDGFLAISPLHHPPLLYITLVGIARARRLHHSLPVPENRKAS
jgi:hypothetical protein